MTTNTMRRGFFWREGYDADAVEEALNLLQGTNGLFVGQLRKEEVEAFQLLIKFGLARRSYEGPSGLLGMARVRID